VTKYIIAAAVFLALVGANIVQYQKIDTLEKQLESVKAERDGKIAEVQTLTTANGKWEEVTQTLRTDLATANKTNQLVQEAADRATAALVSAKKQRDRTLRQLTEAKEKLYAVDQACNSWGAQPVCRGVTVSLQSAWGAAQRDGDNASAGGEVHPALRDGTLRPDYAGQHTGPPDPRGAH